MINSILKLQMNLRENIIKTADKIVHFGWKKEAIPITQIKKSLIGRLFEGILDNYYYF